MAKSFMSNFLKKNLFSLEKNAILHNRVLLYFIFLLSLGNLFYLLVERDITTIVIFLIIGFLTSFFSKNMLIVLFVAIATANILKYGASIRHEGLENMVEEGDKDEVEGGDEAELEGEDEAEVEEDETGLEQFEDQQEMDATAEDGDEQVPMNTDPEYECPKCPPCPKTAQAPARKKKKSLFKRLRR